MAPEFDLIITVRNHDALEKIAKELQAEHGNHACDSRGSYAAGSATADIRRGRKARATGGYFIPWIESGSLRS
jgi:hypothetical protein